MSSSVFCEKCGHLGFIVDGNGTKIPCECRVNLKIRAYLSKFPVFVHPGPVLEKIVRSKFIKPENLFIRMGTLADMPRVNGFLSLALLQLWKETQFRHTYNILNVYKLVDIWFGRSEEFSKALLEAFPESILILIWGAEEARNKEIGQLVRQVVSNRQFQGKKTWFVELKDKDLPDTPRSYWPDNGFKEINVAAESASSHIF